jgi:hypothetical protein
MQAVRKVRCLVWVPQEGQEVEPLPEERTPVWQWQQEWKRVFLR